MDTRNYQVKIWKQQNRVEGPGPDSEYYQIAATPEEAIRTVLKENKIQSQFYAEVHLKIDETDHCWAYTDDDL